MNDSATICDNLNMWAASIKKDSKSIKIILKIRYSTFWERKYRLSCACP